MADDEDARESRGDRQRLLRDALVRPHQVIRLGQAQVQGLIHIRVVQVDLTGRIVEPILSFHLVVEDKRVPHALLAEFLPGQLRFQDRCEVCKLPGAHIRFSAHDLAGKEVGELVLLVEPFRSLEDLF